MGTGPCLSLSGNQASVVHIGCTRQADANDCFRLHPVSPWEHRGHRPVLSCPVLHVGIQTQVPKPFGAHTRLTESLLRLGRWVRVGLYILNLSLCVCLHECKHTLCMQVPAEPECIRCPGMEIEDGSAKRVLGTEPRTSGQAVGALLHCPSRPWGYCCFVLFCF